MKVAKLPNGTELEFPDDTDDAVMDRVVKQNLTAPPENPGSITDNSTMRNVVEGVVNEGPAVGGGIVGGLAATGAGITAIPPLAGIVAFGAGAGEAFKQIGQHLSGSPAAPKTSIEAAKRIAMFGIEQGTWEAVGGLAMKGVMKIIAPYKKKLVEGAEDAINYFKDKIKPIVLMPAEATESRALDLLHNVAESSLVGGGSISKFKTERLKFFDDFADSLIDQFGQRTDPTDLGNLFVQSIENSRKVHASASNVLYNNVSDAIAQIPERVIDVPLSGKGIIYKTADGGYTSFARQSATKGEAFQLPEGAPLLNLDTQRGSKIWKSAAKKADEANRASRESGVATFTKRTPMDEIADLGYSGTNTGGGKTITLAPNVPLKSNKQVTPAGVVNIPTKSLKEFAAQVRSTTKNLSDIEAKNAGDDLISAIQDLPDDIGFDVARELRSRLISRVDEFNVLNKKAPAIGKAKKLISLTDQAIEDSLGAHPDVLDSWRIANRFYKEGSEKFNSTMIRRLVKLADDTGTGAEMIAPSIFKPGAVSKVRKVKAALQPAEWTKMQGFFMEHLMQKSTDVDGVLMGKRLLNHLEGKPGSFGKEMISESFNPQQIEALKQLGSALKIAQDKPSEGAGKVLIQLTQAGALGAVLTGNLEIPAATIIFGPAVLSKMLLNPTVCKTLTTGLTLPAKSPQAAGILARLIAASHEISTYEAETKSGGKK